MGNVVWKGPNVGLKRTVYTTAGNVMRRSCVIICLVYVDRLRSTFETIGLIYNKLVPSPAQPKGGLCGIHFPPLPPGCHWPLRRVNQRALLTRLLYSKYLCLLSRL